MQEQEIRVFDTLEIRNGYHTDKYYRISDWRKDIAIFKSAYDKTYYLINKNSTILYQSPYLNEDELEELAGQQIFRVFGGRYIVKSVYSTGCITYPGQDRDTKYFYATAIVCIISENGEIEKESSYGPLKDALLMQLDLDNECLDLGEDLTIYKKSIFRLSDYSKISDINYEIEVKDRFSNGLCKFYVKDHYADFYVVTQNKKIIAYYPKDLFDSIKNILFAKIEYVEPESKPHRKFVREPDEERIKEVEKYFSNPTVSVEIENYLFSIQEEFLSNFNNTMLDTTLFSLDQLVSFEEMDIANYFTGLLVESGEQFRAMLEKIIAFNRTIPNFVRKIYREGSFDYNGIKTSLYLFECRPFGHISKQGHVIYDFNLDKYNFIEKDKQ